MTTDPLRLVKIALGIAAVVIAGGSLAVSNTLTADLKREEQSRAQIWAEAMRELIRADADADVSLELDVINANRTIPIVLLDESGQIVEHRNIPAASGPDSLRRLQSEAEQMKTDGHALRISVPAPASGSRAVTADAHFTLLYGESIMLQRLAAFPYVQLGVVALFIGVAILALLASKRAEQNKVWVGLSRETAHQLGTPISSLMAWTEVLRESYPDEPILSDLDADVARLQLIADRFSKIGSAPRLEAADVGRIVAEVATYMRRRASGRIDIATTLPAVPVVAHVSAPLLAWVVENLCKNAIDAIEGAGRIEISLAAEADAVSLRVSDTGRGIPRSKQRAVFRPGYTTKARGWGLGLSLARRIVETYHHGRILVERSAPGVGTTFLVRLPRPEGEAAHDA